MLNPVVAMGMVLLTAPTPLDLVTKVHATYLEAGDIEAKFSQTYIGGLRGRKKVETGSLWAKQDGRVRWQYEQPEPKIFIYDGKRAYFYEPNNSQVMIFEDLKNTNMAQALRLLLGQVDIRKHFEVEACAAYCELAKADEMVVELVPKRPLANIERVALVVDPRDNRVRLTTTFDSLGYRTEYRFTAVKFNAGISDKKFKFETPKGVQELRATDVVNARRP